MEGQILQTTDYGQFKIKKGNRELNKGTVNRLVKAISKKNMLPANPIIVNSKLEVIDGQHRLAAAEQLGVSIPYVVFNPASLEEIQMLNVNMRPWGSKDFLESYIAVGKKEYKDFKDFYEKYKYPLYVVLNLLWLPNKMYQTSSHAGEIFKRGDFVCRDLDRSYELAEELEEILAYAYTRVRMSTNFFKAYFYVKYKYPEMIDKLKTKMVGRKTKIFAVSSKAEYVRQFEDILNEGHYGKRIVLY